MPRSSLQRSRPLGVASTVGQVAAWVLRLAFSLAVTIALLGTAGASSSEREGEGERGERGEYGELATKLLTETGEDGESGESDALEACASQRAHSNSGPRELRLDGFCVPRVLAPTVYPRTIQRRRRLRRTPPADDDEQPQG